MADAGSVNLGSAYGQILIDTSPVERNLNSAFRNVERRAGNALDRIGGIMQRAGDRVAGIGTSITRALAPVTLALGAGIRVYGQFDDALAEIAARTGATAEQMERVRAVSLQMGRDTVFSSTQAANAILQLLASGYDLEQTFAALPAVLDAAAAGGMDLGYTADVVTDALAMWQLEASQATRVSDALARGASASSAEINDLAQGLGNVGPLAAQFGLSLEDTVAILAAFSERGIKGAEAGTQLRSMLSNMTRTTDAVAGTWNRLGISLYDAQGNMRPLQAIMGELSAAMAGMTDQERIETVRTLGGAYGQMGLSILTASDAQGDMLALMEQQSDAATVAEARMGSLNGMFSTLRSSVETLLIQGMRPFIENALKPAIRWVTGIVNSITDWAAAHPALMEKLVAVLSLLSALGPVVWAVGKAIAIAGAVVSALGTVLGILFSPIGALIAIGAALYVAWKKNFLGIRDIIQGLIMQWTPWIELITGMIGYMIDALMNGDLEGAFMWLEQILNSLNVFISLVFWPQLRDALSLLAERFVAWVNEVGPPLLEGLQKVATAILAWVIEIAPQVAQKLIEWGKAFVEWIAPFIPPVLAALGRFILAVVQWVIDVAPDVAAKLVEWGKAFVAWVKPYIPVVIAAVGELLSDLVDWIIDVAPDVLDQLAEWGQSFVDWVLPAAERLILKLPGLLADLLTWVLDVTPDIIAQLLDWAAAFVEWVGPASVDLFVALAGLLADLIYWILTSLVPAIQAEMPGVTMAFLRFIDEMINQVGPALLGFLNNVVVWIRYSLIPGVWNAAMDIGRSLVNGIRDGIEETWGSLRSWAEGQANSLVDTFTSVFSIGSPSRVFADIGENIVAGLAQGMNQLGPVEAAASMLVNATMTPAQPVAAGVGVGGNQTTNLTINVPITPETIRQHPDAEEYAQRVGDSLGKRLQQRHTWAGGGVASG